MADVENITLGRGDLYFKPTGASGYEFIGNTPEFNVSISTETLKHYNSGRGVRTQDREVPVQVDYSGGFMTDNITPANLANYFQGDTGVVAVGASTGETQNFANVKKQGRYFLADRNVTNVVVEVGVATKTAGTDYEVDLVRGMITVLDGGTIANGATIEVTYDVTAHSYSRTRSGANVIEGSIMFMAYNPEGENIDYLLESVKLTPNGDFQIKADEWQQLPFNVLIAKPAGGYAIVANGEPFTP